MSWGSEAQQVDTSSVSAFWPSTWAAVSASLQDPQLKMSLGGHRTTAVMGPNLFSLPGDSDDHEDKEGLTGV